MRGFSFALASTMSTLISYAFIICHSPQKSSVAQKVYKRPLRLLRRHLSQRERLWQAGPLPTGRLRPDRTQKGGPCYRGQQLLDNAPCQAAAALDSGALPFPGHRALLVQTKADRHANGSPFGGAGAERLRGQGCYRKTKSTAIASL